MDEQDNRRPQHPALGNKTVLRVCDERDDEDVDRQNVEPARFVGLGERELWRARMREEGGGRRRKEEEGGGRR